MYVVLLVVLTLSGSQVVIAGEPVRGFPIFMGGKNTSRGLLGVDLNKDGTPEIVTVVNDGVTIVTSGADIPHGFPVVLTPPRHSARIRIVGPPLACDVDGNGVLDIVVTSNNYLWAITPSADVVSGYPLKLNGVVKGPAACVERRTVVLLLDTGALIEITNKRMRVVAFVAKGAESGVGVARFETKGLWHYIVCGGDGRLWVVDSRGNVRKGFPYKMDFRSSGIAAVGDIDDDGHPDIVFGSQDFKIHGVNAQGQSLPGFPVSTGYRVYAGVSLGDMDDDGVLDVVVGSGDQKLYAINGSGKALRGFPVQLDGRVVADAVIGDVDRDGAPEIGVVTQEGSLYLLRSNGSMYPGFPKTLGEQIGIAPLLVDIDGDGAPELVASNTKGMLHVLKFANRGPFKTGVVAWAMVGHNPWHTARYGPNPGRFKELGFVNPKPTTQDALQPTYHYFDLDGDAESGTRIVWYKNEVFQPELTGQTSVPNEKTRKHERWHYTLQEGNNFKVYGDASKLSRIFKSKPIEIANTAPGQPSISLTPKDATTSTDLLLTITKEAVDPDHDPIDYRMVWTKNKKVQRKIPPTTKRIRSSQILKNETWGVVVVPHDGEVAGQSNAASVFVRNVPPTAPRIVPSPKRAKVMDTVTMVVAVPGSDADIDRVTYRYRYWVNDVVLSVPQNLGALLPGTLRKGDRVRAAITSHDDEEAGGTTEVSFEVVNTAPSTPKISIWPTHARTGDVLVMRIDAQPPDDDGDVIAYHHTWYLNNKAVDFPVKVAPEHTKKGQRWRLDVIASDGVTPGEVATTERRILNTPPSGLRIALGDYQPRTDATITPKVIVAPTDADNDPIVLIYRWVLDGVPKSFAQSKAVLLPTDTQKGQFWRVEVTPFDGEAKGIHAKVRFKIVNTPPTAPGLQLSMASPTSRDRLHVRIGKASIDLDGDKLTYGYAWFKNGVWMSQWPENKRVLEPGEGNGGENWRVRVTPFDGEAKGLGANIEFRIANLPPSAPSLIVQPKKPRTTDALTCARSKPSVDPDANPIHYEIRWFQNGTTVVLSPDAMVIPPALTHKGESWYCETRATDGDLSSRWSRSKPVLVRNSQPTKATVSLGPDGATTLSDLVCRIDALSADADGDPIRYRYRWWVNKRALKIKDTTTTIAAKETIKGQRWQCEATPFDGTVWGQPASGQVKILNTPPTTPGVTVMPKVPKKGKALHCQMNRAAVDADGDKVSYAFRWYKNGVKQPFAPTSLEVPGRLVKARHMWRCSATATDGRANGAPGESEDVVIGGG